MRILGSILGALLALTTVAHAADLPSPSGDVILTVSGQIGQTNADGKMVFDRAMLAQLPSTSFTTRTNWTEGESEFTGVLLSDLLDMLNVSGTMLKATALNDYSVEIPVSDARPGGPIIAYAMDGAEMSVRNKGPLWIVYPYDSKDEYRSETIYARSIWQLDRLEVVE